MVYLLTAFAHIPQDTVPFSLQTLFQMFFFSGEGNSSEMKALNWQLNLHITEILIIGLQQLVWNYISIVPVTHGHFKPCKYETNFQYQAQILEEPWDK